MAEYGLGRKPHKRDERDYMLREAVPFPVSLPVAGVQWWAMAGHDMRINQGAEGTCVGHGCTNVLMAAPSEHSTFPSFKDPYNAHLFARELYYDATGDGTYQEGAYTRDALNVLVERGQIAAYYRLGGVEEIKSTLLTFGPVTFGSTWYRPMFTPVAKYGNYYLRVDPNAVVEGGHLYCLTGVNLAPTEGPPYVRMENSWGPGWGKNGTARIAIDDLSILFDGDAYVLTETRF
jgi:hypothetical protein